LWQCEVQLAAKKLKRFCHDSTIADAKARQQNNGALRRRRLLPQMYANKKIVCRGIDGGIGGGIDANQLPDLPTINELELQAGSFRPHIFCIPHA